MLSFYTFSLLVLAKVALCQSDQTGDIAQVNYYNIHRYDPYTSDLSKYDHYEVWLNKHYLEPSGASEDIPGTETALNVLVRYQSQFDGYQYEIKCPNTFYWPEDTSKGNTFYISLSSVVKSPSDSTEPTKFVDISKICLYQDLEHPEDERVVESRNPNNKNAPLKKMCCTDQPLTTPPGAEFQPRKLRSDQPLGDVPDSPGFNEGQPLLPSESPPPIPQSSNPNSKPEKVAMGTDNNEEQSGEFNIPENSDEIINGAETQLDFGNTDVQKRGYNNRIQKKRIVVA